MTAAGVPVIPGSTEPIFDAETGAAAADEIGYPVIVKAASAEAAKGCVWRRRRRTLQAFQTAQKETQMAFGDNTMYIEHFVQQPRT
ncbi:Biotin carboxylase [[Clostridium] hylemonae DSM 15053]|nr:Biotin carboxylase [[Clostridium] hylemonae DSM 15053]